MRPYAILTFSLLAILLTGCRIPQPVSASSFVDNLVIQISANADLVQAGQTIKFRATVTNNGPRSEVIDLKDQPVFDLSVEVGPPENRIKTRWSDGKPISADLTRLELKPSESKSIEMDYIAPQCCDHVSASAYFIYDTRFPAIRPSVGVWVGSYPHGALP